MFVSYKRVAVCYLMVTVLMFICVFRVYAIAKNENYKDAAESETIRKITLNQSRGTIFDCNMNRITNSQSLYYAVIFDEPMAMATLYKYFSGQQIEEITQEICKNGFALRTVSREIICDGIYCVKTYSHADDSLIAKHIIGYTDSNGKGVCGLESAYDDLLATDRVNTLSFNISGQGKVLGSGKPLLNYDYDKENDGIRITIDKNIQQIAEQAAMDITCGAVVVTDVKSGKIRALVSRPDYKLSDLTSAINNENEPLLNRVLCTYNIGSVFKPLVAIAGYEKGESATVNCVGYTNIDGLSFACHRLMGHGLVDITDALKFSCNSFFYNYIQQVGAEAVIKTARKAGFESEIVLCDGLKCKKGNIGNISFITTSKRALANLSIGQGELMLSPLAITNLYMAIAGGGSYRAPSLVEGVVSDQKLKEKISPIAPVRIMSKNTADKLKRDLATVLEEGGTGEKAKPTLTSAAGKTGTAQTGVVKNGKKVTNSWFCGFFPFEEPQYAVTVFSENATDGCGAIFAAIADRITEYNLDANIN